MLELLLHPKQLLRFLIVVALKLKSEGKPTARPELSAVYLHSIAVSEHPKSIGFRKIRVGGDFIYKYR